MRARAAGMHKARGELLVDGVLRLAPGQPPETRPGSSSGQAHQVLAIPGGWDITGGDGRRLLVAAAPGEVPNPPAGTAPYDLVALDLLTRPAQLGLLRARGFVRQHTQVVALYTDHRISSEEEMERRCRLWGATAGQDHQLITSLAPLPPTSRIQLPRPHRTLLMGGARSGKSTEAELRLSGEPSVTYLAAGPWANESWAGEGGQPDSEWAARVAAHRAARPGWWRTEESLDVAGALRRETGALLIDGIGTWLAAIMDEAGAWATESAVATDEAGPLSTVRRRTDDFIDAWRQTRALVVAVTDQVGSGLVPPYPAGRIFRDQLGWLNQRLASDSDVCMLVVAGKIVALPA